MFNKDLISRILSGKKVMTARARKLHDVGKVTKLMANKDYSKLSGKSIKFTKIHQKKLGEFNDVDAQKEGFKSLKEFIDYWNRNIKPKNSWNPSRNMWIHEFEVIETANRRE